MNNVESLPIRYLALWAGICGLTYEILFIRLLSIYVGEVYFAALAVLGSVFVGLAIGYWFGARWARYIYVVELLMALFAGAVAVLHITLGVENIIPFFASLGSVGSIALGSLIAMIPMVLVGASIPMLEYIGSRKDEKFSTVYMFYNYGAGLWIILLELLIFQYLGLGQGILICVVMNLMIAYITYKTRLKSAVHEKLTLDGFCNRVLAILFAVSVVSSVWYIYALELSMRIFSTGTQTVSFTIALAILGIAIACLVVKKTSAHIVYLYGALLTTVVFMLLPYLLQFYSVLYNSLAIVEYSLFELCLQLVMMAFLLLPVFVLFGTTIPVWKENTAMPSAYILTTVALGNTLGFMLGYTVLYNVLAQGIPVVVSILCFVALAMYWKKNDLRERGRIISITTIIISMAIIVTWPTTELLSGYRYIIGHTRLSDGDSRETLSTKEYRELGNDAVIVNTRDGTRNVIHLGHHTLVFQQGSTKARKQEASVGLVGALHHTHKPERALIIGLGTGANAGSVSHIYEDVKVYEINPAMIDLAQDFSEDNFGLFDRDNVNIIIEDGIVGVAREAEGSYDMVANNTGRPTFFSANKIYTKEFMLMAKKLLTPNGVYAGWLDNNTGLKGLQVHNDTALSVFKECRYYLLEYYYLTYACGDNLGDAESIVHDYIEHVEVADIVNHLKHLRIDLDLLNNQEINTVNYPRMVMRRFMSFGHEGLAEFRDFIAQRVIYSLDTKIQKQQKLFCEAAEWFEIYRALDPCSKANDKLR